jgi:hypothetical protein
MTVIRRRECGRCGAVVREGKTRHFCGEPYPLKATTDIREVEYVPAKQLRGAVEALREIATRPVVERNPDGDDQAAHTMQMIAREALEAIGEQ